LIRGWAQEAAKHLIASLSIRVERSLGKFEKLRVTDMNRVEGAREDED